MQLMPSALWGRLSTDLPGPRHPDYCQKCGRHRDEIQEDGGELEIWEECDDNDRRAEKGQRAIYVLLCTRCNLSGETASGKAQRGIVARHKRLYEAVEENAPLPGIMTLCVHCAWRDELHCAHPDRAANGGPGTLHIVGRAFAPEGIHITCSPRSQSFPHHAYREPHSCTGREEEYCIDALMEWPAPRQERQECQEQHVKGEQGACNS